MSEGELLTIDFLEAAEERLLAQRSLPRWQRDMSIADEVRSLRRMKTENHKSKGKNKNKEAEAA